MIARGQRWRVCMHEAAHACVGRALNRWEVTSTAFVLESGRGGLADAPDGLTPFNAAVVAAAGEYGERLPFDPPARRRRPPAAKLPPAATAEGIRARALAETKEPAREERHRRAVKTETDDLAVGKYCVALHPTEPEEWARTHAAVHEDAARVTFEHRHEIRRVAVTLFHKGDVTLPGDPRDDNCTGGAVPLAETMPEYPALSRRPRP